MLTQQGIEDPLGEAHLARTLVQFFEGKMVRLCHSICPPISPYRKSYLELPLAWCEQCSTLLPPNGSLAVT